MSSKEKKGGEVLPKAPEEAPKEERGAKESCAESAGEGLAEGLEAEAAAESVIKALESQRDEYKDLYLRKAADFENYRKRMIREKQEAADYANTSLLVDLVQILDDFDRAIAAAEATEQDPQSAFVEGVLMIRKQMASMLESKYGLVYYPSPEGEPFDPNIHEAIGRVPSEDATEPVVQAECRKGYKLKDRVIRLAQVIVKTPPED